MKKQKKKKKQPLRTLTYLTKTEAAEYMRISLSTLSAKIEMGEIQAYEIDGRMRLRREELDAYILWNPFIRKRLGYGTCYYDKAKYYANKGWDMYCRPDMTAEEAKKAKEYVRRATRISKKYAPMAHYYMGLIHKKDGDLISARKEFEIAISLKADFEEAIWEFNLIDPPKNEEETRDSIFRRVETVLRKLIFRDY